ncbi:MAG: hypothetical protein CMD74_02380 [Gammaproteobacteria bacterium]|nr:hypothetical protein [Gammaproteobacteria bacterium]
MTTVELTPTKLFTTNGISPPITSHYVFSPDSTYFVFLRSSQEDQNRLDLWRHNIGSEKPFLWLNATKLYETEHSKLSAAELNQKERKRLFTTGITHIEFRPSNNELLICAEGAAYILPGSSSDPERITPQGTRQECIKFSPAGTYISYVRDDDLFVLNIDKALETQITDRKGNPNISFGAPDFLAAEEMHRHEAHWWSPDESTLAYTKTNNTLVEKISRLESQNGEIITIQQNYPFAGKTNPTVELFLTNVITKKNTIIKYQEDSEDYLARVNWDNAPLTLQVQSRDQKQITVKTVNLNSGSCTTLLEERSKTWINLHDNLAWESPTRLLWTSERSGTNQIYALENTKLTMLTKIPGRVDRILHTKDNQIFFDGWDENASEKHLFRLDLDENFRHKSIKKVTKDAGWHDVIFNKKGDCYLDSFSSNSIPREIRLIIEKTSDRVIDKQEITSSHPYYAYIKDHSFSSIDRIYPPNGPSLYIRLTPPRIIKGKHPIIVNVYGGPGVQRVKNEWPPLINQLFASAGYGIVELDNRGTSNRDKAFEDAIYGNLGVAEVTDQLRIYEYLENIRWADVSRIGIFGHSYGGYMALLCAGKAPEVFKSVVSIAPVSKWELYDTHYTERYLGMPNKNPLGYKNSSVFPYLDAIEAKLLIMHGMSDDNVLLTHTNTLITELQTLNKQFELMLYPGSKHSLQETSVLVHRFNLILDFFARNL